MLQPDRACEMMLRTLAVAEPDSEAAQASVAGLAALAKTERFAHMPLRAALEAGSDVAAVLSMLDEEDDEYSTCSDACQLLATLLQRRDICNALAAVHEVTRTLLARSRYFATELPALTALRNMSASPASHVVLMTEESLPVLLRLLRSNQNSVMGSEPALALVRNLCAVPANRARLMAAGFGSAIVELMQSQVRWLEFEGCRISPAAIAWAACGALFGLACEPANCVPLQAAGALAAALDAFRRHVHDARIAWAVCGLILKLSAVEELLEPLQADGEAGMALFAALQHHSTDERVTKAIAAAAVQARLIHTQAVYVRTASEV